MEMPEPKRSNFNLGRVNRFSADIGYVIPCYVEEILPNSYKRLDIEALIQTNATIAPLMGSFKARFDAFFVPLRLYHRHLDLNNIRPNFNDDFQYHYLMMPSISNTARISIDDDNLTGDIPPFPIPIPPAVGLTYNTSDWWFHYTNDPDGVWSVEPLSLNVGPSTLLDYLGYFPVGYNADAWIGTKRLNATPFIGYFDIWRNFYSNPHDKQVPFRVQNVYSGPFAETVRPNTDWANIIDRYVSLESFDRFIENVNSSSVDNSSGEPVPVDVISLFNKHIHLPYEPRILNGRFVRNIPLFSCQICGDYTGNTASDSVRLFDTRNSMHFGLLPKTYNDDYFNSRFLNEFVTYMEESSKVQVENNTFTISQLRLQNRIAKYIDKSVFSDTRFGSWIKAHFGVKTSAKLNIPQFLGSISSNVVFNDIYASAQTGTGDITSNQALGSRASLGQGYVSNKGSFIEFKATEPGYLMVMFSLTPYVSYTQGIKKLYLKDNFFDMYRPEFDAVGYDDLQKLELYAIGKRPYDPSQNRIDAVIQTDEPLDINEYNVSIGKHPAWLEYMTSYDESHGLFTKKYQYGAWVLNRPFASNVYDELPDSSYITANSDYQIADVYNFDPSTYIRSEEFNSIFAVDKFIDNFQIQVRFFDKTKQPISKQILPHL